MFTKMNYEVFGGGEYPVREDLLNNLTEENRQLARAMMFSGHYSDGIWVDKFLRDDLSINLEKLELAITLAVTMLESSSEDDITLQLRGLEEYYQARGIQNNEKQKREERTFILGFVSSIASEASTRDTLEVKYVR